MKEFKIPIGIQTNRGEEQVVLSSNLARLYRQAGWTDSLYTDGGGKLFVVASIHYLMM
jgi:hypothetical protein